MDRPRILHTGPAIVDIVMTVPRLPSSGGDTLARRSQITVGGGYNVMAAAVRQGCEVVYLGGLGTGPFADLVERTLTEEGIDLAPTPRVPDLDCGHCVALVEDTAERTFVTALGSEQEVGLDALESVALHEHDLVYVIGYSLLFDPMRAALGEWLPTLPTSVRVVFDASPMIGQLPDEGLQVLVEHADIWTLNEDEARILLQRLLRAGDPSAASPTPMDAADLAARLADLLDSTVIVRRGADGALLARPGQSVVDVAAHHVVAVDTSGAGDAHTGVVMAELGRGTDLITAVRRANVAAAVAVTRPGPATCPTAAEIDQIRTT